MVPQATQPNQAPGLGVQSPGETKRQKANAAQLPDPTDQEGWPDSAPNTNAGEERI